MRLTIELSPQDRFLLEEIKNALCTLAKTEVITFETAEDIKKLGRIVVEEESLEQIAEQEVEDKRSSIMARISSTNPVDIPYFPEDMLSAEELEALS